MSISLNNSNFKQVSKNPIVQIQAIDNNSLLVLDQNGILWNNREDFSFSQLSKLHEDFIICFDILFSKNELEMISLGTENGSLQLLNKNGTLQKDIKDAHKGTITCVKFSNDFQTIATAGEDCIVKLWSRNGMLRSEIYQSDSPCYSLCWSNDDQSLALGGQKILTFKSIKPGIKDVIVKASDFGTVLLVKWSKQENYLFSTSEDGKYLVWDNLGRSIYQSEVFQSPFYQGEWTKNSSFFVLGNSEEILLIHKKGQQISRIQSNPLIFCLTISSLSNKLFLGLLNGKIQSGFLNVFQTIYYKNLVIEFPSENTVKMQDINSNYSEVIDYPDKQILDIQPFNDKILIILHNQCLLYKLSNLITPNIFETRKEQFLFSQLSGELILLAFQSVPPCAYIYDDQGKLINTIRFPSQSINSKQVSLSNESIGLIDSQNQKILKILDTKTGKVNNQLEHTNEILEVIANHSKNSNERKFLFFDTNKDLYIYYSIKNISLKIASMVTSFKWHESLDFFVYTTNQKLTFVYSPESILIDKDLFEICSVVNNQIGNQNIEFIHGTQLSLQDKLGFRNTVSLNPLALKIIDLLENGNQDLEEKILQCLKLARFLKDPLVWGILTVFSIINRDSNTAEICLGNLESVDKVEYIFDINNIEDDVVSQSMFYQLINKGKEAENLLIKERKFYETIKMFIKNFEFRKALKVAKKVKDKKSEYEWLVDYVLLHRKRFLEEIGADRETDQFFNELHPQRTFEEIKILKNKNN